MVERLIACPLCGDERLSRLPTPGHWIGAEVFDGLPLGLARCRGCGLVFTNPRPSQDRLGAFYSGDTYTCHTAAGSSSAGRKAAHVLDSLERRLPGVPRVLLDYGAGSGTFLAAAKDRGWEVAGFEPGNRGLANCRGLGLEATGDLASLPPGRFGLITLNHVYEHISDTKDALEGIAKLLAPGGRLFIEVPNAKSLRARLAMPWLSRRWQVDERYRAFPIHLMYYTRDTLTRSLAASGWTVEKAFTSGVGLDEFFIRTKANGSVPGAVSTHRVGNRTWKHVIRDLFLSTGLGENLCVIARSLESASASQSG